MTTSVCWRRRSETAATEAGRWPAWGWAAVLIVLTMAGPAAAQTLRFGNHRQITIPDYATLHVGPFYSTWVFSQSVGYRYTRSEGSGTDFLFGTGRGVIREDGEEFPLVSTLDFRNYVILTRTMDLDMSLSVSYEHYPLETQEDALNVNLADEGMFGDLSTEIILTPFLKCRVYDSVLYRVDYIDTRGIDDNYGGSRYEHFANVIGTDLDWLMAQDRNLALSLSRRDVLPMDPEFDGQELVSYDESLAYEQELLPSLVAGASAGFSQNTYPAATNRPDSASQSYSVFTAARLSDRSTGRLSAGYSIGSVAGDDATDTGNMTAEASLQTRLAEDLSHALSYTRSQKAGFASPFEVYDTFHYGLQWAGELNRASLFSGLSSVDPQSTGLSRYRDWRSGVSLAVPVYVGLMLTDYITLLLDSTYSVRENTEVFDVEVAEVEWKYDYTTWTTRLGTSFPLFVKDVSFSTYVEHTERSSDFGDLAYERDTFEATVTYRHSF